ncbi:hypothetical protein CCAX7_008630 [Capsulimonas corticalis]|uniref:Uncharacterized protein n=1 Tax=Capsulimonas corticalis TaxID=2219043 RepID=A0A402CU22_9BACT|nr:hypothetical protein [Capsulimonas corticalis]BDI28812.1 hypothetical protein CCAX7_008630 [Capsulimonas corticalis]
MMTMDESLSLFGLTPPELALPQIRAILDREAEIERNHYSKDPARQNDERQRAEDLALISAVQLFAAGHLEDVLRIWDTKQTSMDMACALDVQLLCGGGLEQTKSYLSTLASENAQEALKYIGECELTGDFDNFTPDAHLERYRIYFGGDQ